MDNEKLMEYIDHQRWLLNNGMLNDNIKNQLFMYGSIVHKDTKAVELSIDVDNKKIIYHVYVDRSLLKKINKYNKLSKSNNIFGLWRFKRFLKKHGNLNFQHILSNFVKDFCGPKWEATVNVVSYDTYKDGYDNIKEEVSEGDGINFSNNK